MGHVSFKPCPLNTKSWALTYSYLGGDNSYWGGGDGVVAFSSKLDIYKVYASILKIIDEQETDVPRCSLGQELAAQPTKDKDSDPAAVGSADAATREDAGLAPSGSELFRSAQSTQPASVCSECDRGPAPITFIKRGSTRQLCVYCAQRLAVQNREIFDPIKLLKTWSELAREGAFGAMFAKCDSDCDCIVCDTEKHLSNSKAPIQTLQNNTSLPKEKEEPTGAWSTATWEDVS